jgi:hypothetical protein
MGIIRQKPLRQRIRVERLNPQTSECLFEDLAPDIHPLAFVPATPAQRSRLLTRVKPLRHVQRTAALRHLPRLALGNPDDLFRQDHVLERGPSGIPGLERQSAAGMTADAAPTSPSAVRDLAGGFRAVPGVCIGLQLVAGLPIALGSRTGRCNLVRTVPNGSGHQDRMVPPHL